MPDAGHGDIWPALEAVAAMVAALGTCAAAIFALKSAESAKNTICEMQTERKDRVKPVFSLEIFDGFYKSIWSLDPPWVSNNVLPLATTGREVGRYPSISLTNFGGGPALDIEVEFVLLDCRKISFPGSIKHYEFTEGAASLYIKDGWLSVGAINRPSQLAPCCSRARVAVPHCGPGQTRTVFFPETIINFAFVRALTAQRIAPTGQAPADPVEKHEVL